MRRAVQFLVVSSLLLLGANAPLAAETAPPATAAREVAAQRAAFLENGARMDAPVDFTVEAQDRTFFFGPGAVRVAMHDAASPGRWTVRLAFDGADPSVHAVGAGVRPVRTHVFRGGRASWRTDLRTFESISYDELWPGVDLAWHADDRGLKWEATVAPGADPARVRFRVAGAERALIAGDGSFRAETPLGVLADAAPVAWQHGASGRAAVPVRWKLDADVLSFEVGAYDRSLPLVLDPAVFVRSGFLGGASDDAAYAVSTDPSGNIYLAGSTRSPETSFPVLGFDATFNKGPGDAFVAKVSPGFVLQWCSYLGGSADDAAVGVFAAPASGTGFGVLDVWVAGRTQSADFPSTGAVSGGYSGGAASPAAPATTGRSRSPRGRRARRSSRDAARAGFRSRAATARARTASSWESLRAARAPTGDAGSAARARTR
jgi:hypothetical protein